MSTETTEKSSMGAGSSGPRPRTGPAMGGGRPQGGQFRGRPGMGGPGGMRRPAPKRKICRICQDKNSFVDWKAVNFLRNFVTDRGKILAARVTGNCAACQRMLTRAIKRARTMALIHTSPL